MTIVQVREFEPGEYMAHLRARARPAMPVVPVERVRPPPPQLVIAPPTIVPRVVGPAIIDQPPIAMGVPPRRVVAQVLRNHPGVTEQEVHGDRRLRRIVIARHACIVALAANIPRWSISHIGKYLRKDHSTILHALRKAAIEHGRPCGFRTPLSTDQQEAVISRHNSGEAPRLIATELRVSEASVRTLLHNTGLRPKGKRVDHTGLRPKIREMRDRGMFYHDIATALGVCETTIKSHATRMGLPSRLPKKSSIRVHPIVLSSGDPA